MNDSRRVAHLEPGSIHGGCLCRFAHAREASQTALCGTLPLEVSIMRIFAGPSSRCRASVIGHDRMKFTVSGDGKVLTQETKGVDDKTGKPYHYVLTWDKQ